MQSPVTREQIVEIVANACPVAAYEGKRVLVIIPDGTRSGPVGLVFAGLCEQVGAAARALDVLVALGTHQPMSEAAICRRLEMSERQRAERYGRVRFFNHAWNKPEALVQVG